MKNGILVVTLMLLQIVAFAQKPHMEDDKIKQLRIAFISEDLELTPEEGQAFWPVFNAYEKQKHTHEGQLKEVRSEVKGKKVDPTAKQVEDSIHETAKIKVAMAQSEEQYMLDCLKILGPDKTMRLGRSERKFKKALLDKARDRRPDGPPSKQH